MVANVSEHDFKAVIRLRTREARERTGRSQEVMASLLDVETDRYRKWETRAGSAIPHHKIWHFCAIIKMKPRDLLAPPTRDELARLEPPPEQKTA